MIYLIGAFLLGVLTDRLYLQFQTKDAIILSDEDIINYEVPKIKIVDLDDPLDINLE